MEDGEEKGALSREEIGAGAAAGAPSPALPRIIRNKKRRVQVAPTSRRLFDKGARRTFLEWFAGTGKLSLSARKAGFHYRTVLRHRAEDAAFRGEFDLALGQSEVRVEAWLMEARDRGLDVEPSGFDPGGPDFQDEAAAGLDGHAPAHLTAEQPMQLLKDNRQRKDHRAALDVGSGRALKRGRAPAAASNEEVFEALLKGLRSLGVRLEAEEARPIALEGMGEMGEPHQGNGGGSEAASGGSRAATILMGTREAEP